MRAVSPKRAKLLRAYNKSRREFLAARPNCERCGATPTEVHHAAGRRGLMLLRVEFWKALCRSCHRFVTEHPAQAIAEGWSVSRMRGAA